VRLIFVHTSSILNLRGSEKWLLDIASLLRPLSGQVRILNFDYDRKYGTSRDDIRKRRQVITESLAGTQLVELSALRLSLPLRVTPLGKGITRTINRYLNFIPLSSKFFWALRSSDVIYFLQVNRRPLHLLIVLVLATLAGRKRVVAGIHVNPEYTRFEVEVLRFFVKIGVLKGVHVINQSHLKRIRSMLGCRTDYVPNGIFFEKFASGRNGKDRSEFSILFVGAMTHVKGADLLPKIAENLLRRKIPFELQICTSGGPLSGTIQDWGAGRPEVSFRGFVEPKELIGVYRSASVVVLPSRREVFGLTCIEAQASGTPVVVSQADGFRQTVVDGYNGYFAHSFDPTAFSDELARVYDLWSKDYARYCTLCENARENARKNFEWRNLRKEFVLLINRASGASNTSSIQDSVGA
jgi:glycosyltransferase involved in cell wall biosynthesis